MSLKKKTVKIKQLMHELLINRDIEIKKRYLDFRGKNPNNKSKAILLLLSLNVRKNLLNLQIESGLYPDKGKIAEFTSESELFHKSRDSIIREIQNNDVISFDLFDTLILRKVAHPEDVFFLLQSKLEYPGMKRIRVEEERIAREHKKKSHGNSEINIYEIWNRIENRTGIPAEKGIQAEWESEIECCYPNPFFKTILENRTVKNKRIVITTDTYWGIDNIKELLECNDISCYNELFVSCDYNKSKADGELFDIVKKRNPNKRILHIGDNRISDIKIAKEKGLNTHHYPNVQIEGMQYRSLDMSPIIHATYSGIVNAYLHNGVNIETKEFELGFIYGGLFVTGFCQFIKKIEEDKCVDKILFLARDGDVLKEAFEKLYPNEKAKCEYVYWSRLASLKACANSFKSMFIERMICHKINQKYTINECFKTMDIPTFADRLYEEFDIGQNDYLTKENSHLVIAFIINHWDEILKEYELQMSAACNYISETISGSKKVMVVDIGWTGSGYMMIGDIKNQIGSHSIACGVIAGTAGAMTAEAEDSIEALYQGDIDSYIFSPIFNREIWKKHDVAKDHNLIMEILLCSPNPSLISFSDANEEMVFSQESEYKSLLEIRDGILRYIDIFINHPFRDVRIPGCDAYAPIALILQSKKMLKEIMRLSDIRGNIE